MVLRLVKRHEREFASDPARAEELLKTGISPVPDGIAATELAAWTSVARALYNKHEFLMRY